MYIDGAWMYWIWSRPEHSTHIILRLQCVPKVSAPAAEKIANVGTIGGQGIWSTITGYHSIAHYTTIVPNHTNGANLY